MGAAHYADGSLRRDYIHSERAIKFVLKFDLTNVYFDNIPPGKKIRIFNSIYL